MSKWLEISLKSRVKFLQWITIERQRFVFSIFSAKEKIFFILISTDYVFDGKNPPYKEDDTPNPLQSYGKSKYEAELVTMKTSKGSFSFSFLSSNAKKDSIRSFDSSSSVTLRRSREFRWKCGYDSL